MGKALVPAQAREAELERMMQAYGNLLAGLCTGLLRDRDLAQVGRPKAGKVRLRTLMP